MNILNKTFFAGLLSLVLMGATAMAQPAPQGAPAEPGCEVECQHHPMMGGGCHGMGMAQEFTSVKSCYDAQNGVFVLIDSIDCAIDILRNTPDSIVRVAHYVTDDIYKRHDLKRILRPKSVQLVGNQVLFVASAVKDSAYLGVLDLEGNLLNRIAFQTNASALQLDPVQGKVIVFGTNPVGYDIHILCARHGFENMNPDHVKDYHYHVAKQSEKIQESDPVGIGLTVVAVAVVFLALLCISLILQGYAKAIKKVQDKRAAKAVAAAVATGKSDAVVSPSAADVAGDVYAAIAAAIYLYDEEMHDEEDTVLTIQKVERAWTPWNAKFYNMNQYFNNRK